MFSVLLTGLIIVGAISHATYQLVRECREELEKMNCARQGAPEGALASGAAAKPAVMPRSTPRVAPST